MREGGGAGEVSKGERGESYGPESWRFAATWMIEKGIAISYVQSMSEMDNLYRHTPSNKVHYIHIHSINTSLPVLSMACVYQLMEQSFRRFKTDEVGGGDH